jgi:hypothetical protein
LGVLFDVQWEEDSSAGLDGEAHAVIAGAEFNLNRNPEHSWAVGVQGIYYDGFGGVDFDPAASEGAKRFALRRGKFWSAAASIRYTGRPNLLTRSRAALSFAYKDYPDKESASEFSIVPSYVYRLGHAIDLVGQYMYTHRDDGLAEMEDFETVHQIVLGVSFGFDQVFNDQIGERQSILNLEHGYIQ